MKLYLLGKVVSIGNTYIIYESNNMGSIIYVTEPESYEKEKDMKLYIYIHKTEYSHAIYGFKNFKERILFNDLIGVSGVGPKTSLAILKGGVDNAVGLISNGDAKLLSNIPSLGIKTAGQIIFELQYKYKTISSTEIDKSINKNEIKESLKILGFKKHQIDFALSNLPKIKDVEAGVEESIRLISNAKFA